MTKYEYLMLATPGITGDEASGLEKQFQDLLKKFEGNFVSFDRWGKCRLAYPVKHHDYGVYYMARFEMTQPQEFLKELKLVLDVRYNDLVMRTATVKVATQAFSDFRPDAVEDIPTRNVDQFLRENKMEGLINKKETPSSQEEKTAAPQESVAKTETTKEASTSESTSQEGTSE
jgi:small subunit ribosomal protein S6